MDQINQCLFNNKQQIILTALGIADRTSKSVTVPHPCGLGFFGLY
jgi:hypothetical protein